MNRISSKILSWASWINQVVNVMCLRSIQFSLCDSETFRDRLNVMNFSIDFDFSTLPVFYYLLSCREWKGTSHFLPSIVVRIQEFLFIFFCQSQPQIRQNRIHLPDDCLKYSKFPGIFQFL